MAAIYTSTPLPAGVRRKGNLYQARVVVGKRRICSPGFATPAGAAQWREAQIAYYTSKKQDATA